MNLRGVAAETLAQVISGQSLTTSLNEHLGKIKEHNDRAFVQALCYGVIRQYYSLEFILKRLLSKPLKTKDNDIKSLLLIGLYQLQYMRVKPHAAVSETVAAAKHKPWAKSLINAILRSYLRDPETLQQAANTDREAHYNHPAWIIDLLMQDWPQHFAELLTANDQAPPMALRVNTLQNARDQYLELLNSQGITAQSIHDHGLLLDQAISVEQLPGFFDGCVSVQDSAAQLAAKLLELQAGQSVLDVCAAPGGKTAAILEQQPALTRLLALDIDEQRLHRVKDNLQRLKLDADVLAADATQPDTWAQQQTFDRILLDAPCSGLGVVRRHPDIKLLRRATDIANLQLLQAQILNAVWPLLKPGGILLYATCSVLKQENENQIADFLNKHADALELTIQANWGETRPHGRQILTGRQQMDGFYYAKICKTA